MRNPGLQRQNLRIHGQLVKALQRLLDLRLKQLSLWSVPKLEEGAELFGTGDNGQMHVLWHESGANVERPGWCPTCMSCPSQFEPLDCR